MLAMHGDLRGAPSKDDARVAARDFQVTSGLTAEIASPRRQSCAPHERRLGMAMRSSWTFRTESGTVASWLPPILSRARCHRSPSTVVSRGVVERRASKRSHTVVGSEDGAALEMPCLRERACAAAASSALAAPSRRGGGGDSVSDTAKTRGDDASGRRATFEGRRRGRGGVGGTGAMARRERGRELRATVAANATSLSMASATDIKSPASTRSCAASSRSSMKSATAAATRNARHSSHEGGAPSPTIKRSGNPRARAAANATRRRRRGARGGGVAARRELRSKRQRSDQAPGIIVGPSAEAARELRSGGANPLFFSNAQRTFSG